MSLIQSPLFEPVLWQGTGFDILDEIQVPEKIQYIHITEVAQALDAVRQMKTRAFGQVLTFLYSGALIAARYSGSDSGPLHQQLAQMTQQFCDARPTFDFRGLGCFFEKWLKQLRDDSYPGEIIAKEARECGQQIISARRRRAQRAAAVLPNPTRLLTHCNVSGELVAMAGYSRALGKDFSVVATETRPYLQGARLTAWELAQAGIHVELIPDCGVAQVLAKRTVNAVIVGADRCARNGDIVNKVGTYPIARLARECGVPFYALVQDPQSLERGGDVPIEERPMHELLSFQGQPLVPGDASLLRVRYPSFDVTPAEFITGLIDFEGVYTPETYRQKYQAKIGGGKSSLESARKYVLIYGIPPETQYAFLLSLLRAERADSLLVPEMRPSLRGAQVVARALSEHDGPVTLIADNMMGTLFASGEICKLCFFYSGLAEEGPHGICGSLLAVQLARLHGVPIEIHRAADSDESTSDLDVATFLGRSILPTGASIYPLETEVVPWALFKDPR